jgi:poly(3-hydroxybutyrate) depolymerase
VIVLSGRKVTFKRMKVRYTALHDLGFAVVYPQATHNLTWNLGSYHGAEYEFGVNDLTFVEDIARHFPHPTVYLTGTSLGSMLSSILALQYASKNAFFHGVGLIAGYSVERQAYVNITQPTPSFPILAMHSHKDYSVSILGHRLKAPCKENCTSFGEARQEWMRIQGCHNVTRTTVKHGRTHQCFRGEGCAYATLFCEFASVGHEMQGAGAVVADFFSEDLLQRQGLNSSSNSPTYALSVCLFVTACGCLFPSVSICICLCLFVLK